MNGRPKSPIQCSARTARHLQGSERQNQQAENTIKWDLRETSHKEVPCSGRRMRFETPVKRPDSKNLNSRQKRLRQTPPWRSQEEASGQMVSDGKSQAVREHGREEQPEDAH